MSDWFKGKVVIVTGASSGIGKALVYESSKRGAKVVLAARRTETLKDIATDLTNSGTESLVISTDVSKEEDCKHLIGKTIEYFGSIDVLINNAGVSMRALFEDTDLSVLKRIIDVNFWGTVYCTRYALPWLIKSKGSLVGISSVAGFKGLPGRTGYSASKFAIQGFLESVRIENMKKGLHVLIVCPGFTGTEIRNNALKANGDPQGISPRDESNMMHPEVVAKKTLRAVAGKRRLLILTLTGKLMIAFQRFFPTRLDHIVYKKMAKEPDSPFK